MDENIRRAIFFDKPSYIPMRVWINPACWHHYPQEWLVEQMESHPLLFHEATIPSLPYTPNYGPCERKGVHYVDDFGCTWATTDDGITGTVIGHPLTSWDQFINYRFPDPEFQSGLGPRDWSAIKHDIDVAHAQGEFVSSTLRHGHTFLQLCDIRGYENLLCDMADEEPLLNELIEGVEEFNNYQVKKFVELGADMIGFPEDLGMQVGPMLSPKYFRRYIKPSYVRMMKNVTEKGLPVRMHSDGDIRQLIDDIIDSGVAVMNLQDLVNGIDWIRDHLRGKVCIDLDVDRQKTTVYGTPAEIDALIYNEVKSLACPDGGMMAIFGLYPGTPLKNVEALFDAMTRYMQWY